MINHPLRVSKVSWKSRIPAIYNFAVIYPQNLLISLKVAYFLTVSIVFSVYNPRFQPTEHPLTSPIHIVSKTGTTTTIQNMQQGFKKHMSTMTTQYDQPILKTTAKQQTQPTFKTTVTQYTQPTFKNHTSTCTKAQLLPPKHYCLALPTKHTPYIETHVNTCTIS